MRKLLYGATIVALVATFGVVVSSNTAVEQVSATTIRSVTPTSKLGVTNENNPIKDYTVKQVTVDARNVVMFNTSVNTESVEITLGILDSFVGTTTSPVYLVIDSPGGSVVDGSRLLAYIESIQNKLTIHTVCYSFCASMAAHLHQIGKQRYMFDKSILMFHQASGGARGTIEQMISQLSMFKTYIDRLDAKVAARSGLDYTTFKNQVANELWVEAVDAVDMKLADGLIMFTLKKGYEVQNDVNAMVTAKYGKKVKETDSKRELIFDIK